MKRKFSNLFSKNTNLNLYFKILLPIYFKMFFKNCIFCNTLKYIKINTDKNSLINNIGSDINKGIIFIFTIILAIYSCSFIFFIKISIEGFIIGIVILFIILIFCFLIINILLLNSLKKNIIDKFDKIKLDINNIEKGNLSKRIRVKNTSYELKELINFTNSLLHKLETAIDIEKKKALIDPLTSCYNRRAMNINFDYIKNKSIRDNYHLSIVALDLDYFKKVNDTYGHNIGDKVLIEFVKTVKQSIRNYDFIYRTGGEEFIIIFPNINKKKTKLRLKKLTNNIKYRIKKNIPKIENTITVSGGYVNSKDYDLNQKNILNKMIDDADKLLYKAKKDGRDRIYGK